QDEDIRATHGAEFSACGPRAAWIVGFLNRSLGAVAFAEGGNFLRYAILENGEVRRPQIGDVVPFTVRNRDVEENKVDVYPEDRFLGLALLLAARLQSRVNRDPNKG